MGSSLAKKNTTRFLIYSFVGLLVFSMGVFAMLGVYMSRKSTKTIHEVGEIYMSGMSEQMARHFENIIELRFAQVEGIVSVVPSKSADKEAMYADSYTGRRCAVSNIWLSVPQTADLKRSAGKHSSRSTRRPSWTR